MRFFEFAGDDNLDKFVVVLRNFIGRHSSKRAPAILNWAGLSKVLSSTGANVVADYDTFKSIYDANPQIQAMVKDFNGNGVTLKVPGSPDNPGRTQDGETSQDAVDKIAAGAASNQLSQQNSLPAA
jgi:hypothetical protein